jgi:3-phosphoshikimate 1-carboxyvinyltransferase
VPSSKSHTIRALLIAACAEGPSKVINSLDSADARSCAAAIRTLGAEVTETSRTATGISLTITPPPGGILSPGRSPGPVTIDVGNSGTTLFLLTALAAHRREGVRFEGDESIRRRDASPLLNTLREMGARVEGGPCAPYTVAGPLLPGKTVRFESPTSQYLSALLLAAPLIAGDDQGHPTVLEPTVLHERPYVDMTWWWLEQQEIRADRDEYRRFRITPGQRYRPIRETLPGDYSSATFWFAAAAVTGGSFTVTGLAPDDVQGDRGVLGILDAMGCRVRWHRAEDNSPAVTVSGPILRGGVFDLNAMPDALPALAVAACYGTEPVTLANVPQARAKETDRIAVMAGELSRLGARIRELPDGLEILPGPLTGGTLNSHDDHRVAMAGAIAALGAGGPVRIKGADAAAVTYPSFYEDLSRLAPESLPGEETGKDAGEENS